MIDDLIGDAIALSHWPDISNGQDVQRAKKFAVLGVNVAGAAASRSLSP